MPRPARGVLNMAAARLSATCASSRHGGCDGAMPRFLPEARKAQAAVRQGQLTTVASLAQVFEGQHGLRVQMLAGDDLREGGGPFGGDQLRQGTYPGVVVAGEEEREGIPLLTD